MRKLLISMVLSIMIFSFTACCDGISNPTTEQNIILAARRASVQPLFYTPILKVSFTDPLPEKKELTAEYINELLEEKLLTRDDINKLLEERKLTYEEINKLLEERIKAAIESERRIQEGGKYQDYLTSVEEWGVLSPSQTEVPLGVVCPEWAKYPERVLVVRKVEEKEIAAWEKEYEKDVLTIAETANVSPSKAREIVDTLKTQGYAISKQEVDVESEVILLWFRSGWSDSYPETLNWEVSVEDTKTNIIIGYDARGILEVKPIPDGKRIYVKAGYLDLKPEYRPKSSEVKTLETKLEMLKKDLEDEKQLTIEKDKSFREKEEKLAEDIADLEEKLRKEKGETKRDISKVTWLDIKFGTVKLERFWAIAGGTGTYLGDMKCRSEAKGWQYTWGGYFHNLAGSEKSVILTNAHVAVNAMDYSIYVSEDKEVMWITYPGKPYIRFTQDSDMYGSPAQLLCYDEQPILSDDYDTAIMVTTKIPGYSKYRAILGNSDNVKQGDSVLLVGNPSLLQKFASEGLVSNKDYNFLKDQTWHWLPRDVPHSVLNKFMNCTMWYDNVIGIGGTSGSGIWALQGSEAGKVIALHALGLIQPLSIACAASEGKGFNVDALDLGSYEVIAETARKYREKLFANYSHKEAKFQFCFDDIAKEHEMFKEAMASCGKFVWVTGMSAGVPINKVKSYLQERGLDPDNFNWEGLSEKYWEK